MSIFLDSEFPDSAEEMKIGKFIPLATAALEKKNPHPLLLGLPPCWFPGRELDRKGWL